MVAESSASRSLRPASKAIPLAELHHRRGLVRMHGWRGQVETKRASEKGPVENLTPTVSGSQEFVLGLFRWLRLRAGDDDVVRGIGFAVRAEGAEGVVVLLAVVLIGTMPWIDADYAR